MTPLTRRRLNDLEVGALIPRGKTRAELLLEKSELHDAIVAGQSLDSLGSPEADEAAWDRVKALLARDREVDRLLAELPNNSSGTIAGIGSLVPVNPGRFDPHPEDCAGCLVCDPPSEPPEAD